MKRVKTTILMAICCIAVSIQSATAQEEAVRAAMEESLAAWSAADFQTLGSFYATQARGFMLDGGMLISGFSAEALEAAVSAGFGFNVEPRDVDIMMIGETAAVAVAIVEGAITMPGGAVQEGSWRYSETRVKEGGVWKVVQYHFSPLTLAPLGDIP
jgi:ketosteroid isomerase-like protein